MSFRYDKNMKGAFHVVGGGFSVASSNDEQEAANDCAARNVRAKTLGNNNNGQAMARKDMSMAQFVAACKRRRFVPSGFLGYYRLGTTGTCVSVLNAGGWRRNQLAYLIQQHDQIVNQNGN